MSRLIQAAAVRASGYAARMAAQTRDARTTLNALALAHLCRTIAPTPATLQAWSKIASESPNPDWLASDLLTGLTAAAGMLETGDARAADYLRLLVDLRQTDGLFDDTALLEVALTGGPALGLPRRSDAAIIDGLLAGMETPDFAAVLTALEAASAFGQVPLSMVDPIPDLLEGAAAAALRAYDLPLGARLLRARRYASPRPGAGLETGLAFLLSSQAEDGGFGDYDTAIATLNVEGQADAEARIRLPVSFQALWTLAELEDPALRLARRVFGADGLAARIGVAA